jgi:hypothetical protein
LKNVRFYVYGATAPDRQLLGNMTETYGTVHDYLKKKLCIDLYRTITTHDVLIGGIVNELKRRKANGVDVPHLALIFEENTFYGRILPQELERQFAPGQCGESLDCP